MRKPFMIVVTGRPGSGKTTLAHKLADQIHCPALCRDEFKEGYVHTVSRHHDSLSKDVNWQIYHMFFDTVNFVISKEISVVVEAAFQHKLWEPKLTPLVKKVNMSIIVCSVDPQVAKDRLIERCDNQPAYRYFHGSGALHIGNEGNESFVEEYTPPELDIPTMMVETTNGYAPSLSKLIDFTVR